MPVPLIPLLRALYPLIFTLYLGRAAIEDLMPGLEPFLRIAAWFSGIMRLADVVRRPEVGWVVPRGGQRFVGFDDDDVLLVQMDMPRRPNALGVWIELELVL